MDPNSTAGGKSQTSFPNVIPKRHSQNPSNPTAEILRFESLRKDLKDAKEVLSEEEDIIQQDMEKLETTLAMEDRISIKDEKHLRLVLKMLKKRDSRERKRIKARLSFAGMSKENIQNRGIKFRWGGTIVLGRGSAKEMKKKAKESGFRYEVEK